MKPKPLPPLKVLQEHFRYNPYTGELRKWTTGSVAKRLDSRNKYVVVDFLNKTWQAHRICFYLGTGNDPGLLQVDHIDQNKRNNILTNLRLLDNAKQQENTKLRDNNRSGHKGVCYDKKSEKWRSYITVNKKKLFVYYGDSWDEAVRLRGIAERKYYPELYLDYSFGI